MCACQCLSDFQDGNLFQIQNMSVMPPEILTALVFARQNSQQFGICYKFPETCPNSSSRLCHEYDIPKYSNINSQDFYMHLHTDAYADLTSKTHSNHLSEHDSKTSNEIDMMQRRNKKELLSSSSSSSSNPGPSARNIYSSGRSRRDPVPPGSPSASLARLDPAVEY